MIYKSNDTQRLSYVTPECSSVDLIEAGVICAASGSLDDYQNEGFIW